MAFDDNILTVYFFFSVFHVNISPNRSDILLNQQFAVMSELSCELSHNCNLIMGEKESCSYILKIFLGGVEEGR